MNIEGTRQYYARLTDADICSCAYCRNYIKEIKAAYPDLTVFLDQNGIDIEKPFEAMPIDPVNGMLLDWSEDFFKEDKNGKELG